MTDPAFDALRLDRIIADRIVEHARADHPIEACGVVASHPATGRQRLMALPNAAHSEVFYELSSDDLLALYRELDTSGEQILVVYHSHTRTAAYPSATDIELASEPSAYYLLVSTPELRSEGSAWRTGSAMRAFRIVQGSVHEVAVELV